MILSKKIWTLFSFKIQSNRIKLFNIPMLSFCHMPNILGQKGIIFFGQDFAIPKANSVQKACIKCLAVHTLKFEILKPA